MDIIKKSDSDKLDNIILREIIEEIKKNWVDNP